MNRSATLIQVMWVSTLLLALEIVLWEIWLAPLHPGAGALALLAVPVLCISVAAWRRHNYGLQIGSMLILPYLAEGAMRAINDGGVSQLLAILEIILAATFFAADLLYLGPLKRDSRKAKQL